MKPSAPPSNEEARSFTLPEGSVCGPIMVHFLDGHEEHLDSILAELKRYRTALLQETPAPEKQEPVAHGALASVLRSAVEWLDRYAGEIEAGHYMPGSCEWNDADASADFSAIRVIVSALRRAAVTPLYAGAPQADARARELVRKYEVTPGTGIADVDDWMEAAANVLRALAQEG